MAESWNHFPAIAAGFKPALQRIESERILDLEMKVKSYAPVLSGFLQSSVYGVLPDGTSDYGNAMEPPGDSYLLPEETPPDDMSGIVGVAANYGEFVNYGTRFMAAQPFFDQATEAAGVEFEAKFAALEDILRGLI
jgi:hypothetical protein